jgi:hypothetical protein
MQFLATLSQLFHPQRSNNHRSRLLYPDSILSLVGLVLGFSLFVLLSGKLNPELGSILGYASDITANDVIVQTNAERAKGGLAPLQFNEELSQAASGKANDMFAKQYWAHQSPDGVEPWAFIAGAGYTYVAAGENLARDFMVTPDMVAAWMASPTHAANIMNARYQEIGVAVVNGTLEGIETTLVVQMFGRPQVQKVAAQVAPQAAKTEIVTVPTSPEQVLPPAVVLPTSMPVPVSTVSPTVLSDSAVPVGNIETRELLFSPLQLTKSFGLSVLLLIVATLLLDWYVSHKKGTVRVVGKNFAHILYFVTICFVVILFRGGFVF